MKFQTEHLATLAKYAGISFVAGAVNHGFLDLLGFGIVASIGLGFFTGGLQHFPDSPGRSLWRF